jgi:iron(III) transport system ATP-binding protein
MNDLILESVTKTYGEVDAIKDVSLTVAGGEFLTLLGPSGCGKSTTLAAIAGLDRPTGGRIAFRGTPLFDGAASIYETPERRGFGVVFQSYALWPHLTVERNVSMPLELRRVGKAERARRVAETLELVGLAGYGKRYPGELSGGQQQRVALARAVVFRPPLLLLDEPLSNLDAQLRQQARVWLKDIQRELGLTAIYVTHDQEEALAMSDRIVLMRAGRIVQIGTPQDIYERPQDPFAATFIGSANLIDGTIEAMENDAIGRIARFRLADGQVLRGRTRLDLSAGQNARLAVRSERIAAASKPGDNVISADFGAQTYLGDHYEQRLALAGQEVRMRATQPAGPRAGRIHIALDDALVFGAG